jgi:hypothetical protein
MSYSPCWVLPSSSAKRTLFDNDYNYKLIWETNIPSNMYTRKNVISDLARWYCSSTLLREITRPNFLSHVVVKVLRCERVVASKSDSWGATFQNNNTVVNDALVTHVTLSDGPEMDELLGMGAATSNLGGGGRRNFITIPSIPRSISSVLLRSMEEGSLVLLTHVLSRTSLVPCPNGGNYGFYPDTRSSILRPRKM